MNITTHVNLAKSRKGFAETTLEFAGEKADLRVSLADFGLFPIAPPIGVDLLLVGSVIYAVDQLISRRDTRDGWTRSLSVAIPVREADRWNGVAKSLAQCVSFLTGDVWRFSFNRLKGNPAKVKTRKIAPSPKAKAVCLFSGGLDSLVGAIDWLSASGKGHLVLVGHHDKKGRAQADQKRLISGLEQHRPRFFKRVHPRHVAVWQSLGAADINYRSRSFLFLALGFYAASALGGEMPVIIPENGTIAVNVPLTPSRRGSCSTRTAHPYFIEQYQAITRALGLANDLVNPFILRTKGEVVANCQDMKLLKLLYQESVSCAKSSRRVHWVRKDADHCGHCMPCICRRAAIHAAGLPPERYGLDICQGEIDLDGRPRSGDDFRALFHFLRRRLGRDQIAALLSASSTFGSSEVGDHAAVVERAMDEIRAWLKAESPKDIRQRAMV